MIKFTVLASGSKGNCVFVEADGVKLFLDAGLNFKNTNKRMSSICKRVCEVNHIFISHQHGDHIVALGMLKKHNRKLKVFSEQEGNIVHGQTIDICNIKITAFRLDHDEDCLGYIVEDHSGNKLAYVSDTGSINCESLKYLIDVNAIIIEANHDTDMLFESWYSEEMQQRVYETHFENSQAHDLLKLVSWDGLDFVIGHHLSKVNNKAELAYFELRSAVHEKCNVVIASQEEPTKMMTII